MPDVPELVRTLRDEHDSMGDVLDELERQLARIANGQPPETANLSRVVEYCLSYPAQLHHRKEDLLIARLRARDADAAAAASDLEGEHENLVKLTERLTAAARDLIERPAASCEDFSRIASTFVSSYRNHIDAEERYLFPAAIWSLSPRDWHDIHHEIEGLQAEGGKARRPGAKRAGRAP